MVPLLTFPFLTSPIDIEREEARRRAIQELLGAEYAKESLVDRLWRGMNQFLGDLLDQESAGVVGSLAARAVLIVIVIGIIVAVFLVARRTTRGTFARTEGLFGDRRLTAAEHREAAERLAAEARWAEAVRERLRLPAQPVAGPLDLSPVVAAGQQLAQPGAA
ncbi:hypothetical protein ABZ260_43765, partial [Streptosporangium sp. NPDC006013]|uniref:hypothetical protein n=1 Tax=Streptosporangium sp. NPDC006013 TaxID=3155596 RepID=UPI0033BA7336